jgi:hypothetical protein
MCHRLISSHAQYVVKIEVYADPAMPEVTRAELEETDYAEAIRKLLESMKDVPARELQDDVYRRFQFHLCPGCQRRYLENPLPPA